VLGASGVHALTIDADDCWRAGLHSGLPSYAVLNVFGSFSVARPASSGTTFQRDPLRDISIDCSRQPEPDLAFPVTGRLRRVRYLVGTLTFAVGEVSTFS
jgi:hypothetical protein